MVNVIPCAPGAHIGEMKTLGFLRQNLPGNHTILTNYHLPDGSVTLEIDLLLMNSYGIFLLEVKHWWGRIEADQTQWLHAGRRLPSPITSIDYKAKVVHSRLSAEHPALREVSVVGFVVLSKGDALFSIDDPRADRVFILDSHLIHAVSSSEYLFNPERFVPIKSRRLRAAQEVLLRQHVDPERHLVGSYQIVSGLIPGEGYEAFEAQHVDIKNRRVRLKRYHIPEVRSQRHLLESVHRFRRDMEVLSEVEGHPNIIRAYDFFKDPDVDDTYYLTLEIVDGRSLREIIDLNENIDLSQSLQYLIPVAEVLDFCHQHNIVHRNLTPSGIYVTYTGQVMVGDFDFARVPDISMTISKTGQPLVANKYTAPEQINNPRNTDARADLYSLGVIWYDVIFRRPRDEAVLMSVIEEGNLPDMHRRFMRSLLSRRPEDRPSSALEVKEWFELLVDEGQP